MTPGGFGGSLGYTQTTNPFPVNGILGGYLGVGLDGSGGNFGNNNRRAEGRDVTGRTAASTQTT